jgi:glycosyltransferase involved in cell wall biosynthesis
MLVSHVHVVLPVHDEEELLPRALAGLAAAVDRLRSARLDLGVDVTVVLDDCHDSSAAVVKRHPWARRVTIRANKVGSARRAGVALATSSVPTDRRHAHWVASTDADCVVGPSWLVNHVRLAEAGADLVTGTVEPDGDDTDEIIAERWWRLHDLADGHPYVHGANLGVRLSVYDEVGGFAPVRAHEDVGLVERVRAGGHVCVASAAVHIRTSGRLLGRAPHGFSAFLTSLTVPSSAVQHRASRRALAREGRSR